MTQIARQRFLQLSNSFCCWRLNPAFTSSPSPPLSSSSSSSSLCGDRLTRLWCNKNGGTTGWHLAHELTYTMIKQANILNQSQPKGGDFQLRKGVGAGGGALAGSAQHCNIVTDMTVWQGQHHHTKIHKRLSYMRVFSVFHFPACPWFYPLSVWFPNNITLGWFDEFW